MANKPNDFFATLMFQPNTTFEDMAAEGLTADNLGLQSRDYYKDIQQVKDTFVDKNGKFDNKAYDNFYDNCLSLYNEYAMQDYKKLAIQNFEYNPDVWWAPKDAKKMNTDTKIILGKNPMKINVGVNYLTSATNPTMSIREIAQANAVRDFETGEVLDWTPNERGGLFKSLSRPTLVLATWDEDGTHEENGRIVQHRKGEYKFDEDGSPYYETLGDRESYDKEVLQYTDTFTTDGSKLNKFDFFDSDGLDKSIGGTLMKTAMKTLPMLIPYVGPTLGAAGAALALSQLVPVLAKSINGLISSNDNDFGKTMTKFENYMSRFNGSTSDYSRNKLISMENLGGLVSSISGQLFQQKAIGMIPGLLGNPNNADHVKLGQKMALAYMAGTSAKENYGAFINAGANEETAGLAMFASMFALYGLMNSEYLGYKDTLFKGSWLDESVVKNPAMNVAREWGEKIAKEGGEAAVENAATKKGLFNWMKNAYSKHFKDALTKQTFIASSVNEGLEEVMEEGVADITKALTKGAEAFGIKVTDSNNKLDFGTTLENTLSRYAMAFGGGMLGGAIFQMHGKWDDFLHNKFLENAEVEDLAKLTYMIAEGRTEEIRDYYRKWHKEGRLGSTNLSTKFETIDGVKGEEVISEPLRDGLSHNDIVFNALMQQVDLIEQILSEEQLKVNEKTLGEILKMNGDDRGMALADTFVKSGIMGSFLNEFNRLATQIVKKRGELNALLIQADKPGDTAASEEATKKAVKNNAEIKKLEEELKVLREQRDAILNGERNDYYMGQILFVMNDELNKHFVKLTKDNFAQSKLGKRYDDLNDVEKDLLDDDYNDYIAHEGKYDLYRAYDVYLGLSELWTPKLMEAAKSLKGYGLSKSFKGQYGSDYFKTIANVKKLEKVIDELKDKESLTPEEAEKLKESEDTRDSLIEYLLQLEQNPELATQQIISDETVKKFRLLGTDADEDSIFDDVAKTIEDMYTKAKDKKEVLSDDNDLNGFYSTYIKARFGSGVSNKFRNLLDFILNPTTAPEMGSIDELLDDNEVYATSDSNFFSMTSDQSQLDFIEQVEIFTKSLGKDNIAAIRAYREAERILRTSSTAPDELIEFFMNEMFGTINGESVADFVQKIDDIRREIKYHPFEDLFAEFVISVNGTPSKLLDILRSEEKRLALQENLLDYTMDNDFVKEELREIGLLLNAFRGIIHGAFDGTNSRINPYRQNIKGKELLADLDETSAKILLEDAKRLQMRIDTLLRINEASQSRKSKMQQKIACNMRPKFIKSLLNPAFIQAVKDKFKGIDLEKIWESIAKPDDYVNIDSIGVNEQNYADWEAVFVEFESKIFEEFKSIYGKDIYKPDFAKTLHDLFGNDLSKMITTRLTDDPNVTVESYDLMNYFASVIAINASDFYSKYKEVVESDDFAFAPIFAQEMSVREMYAMALRPDLFNNLAELLKQEGHSDPYVANKTVLKNIMLTLAGAGTGKTTGIANIVVKMLDGENTDFVVLAPTKIQVEKLAGAIGKEDIPKYTRDDIFKFITDSDSGVESKHIFFNEEKAHFEPKDIKISDKLIFDGGKPLRVLVIDEIACFNEVELKLLNEYAEKHGIFIIGLGDFKQTASKNEGTVKGEVQMVSNGVEDFVSLRTPSPTASLRASNVAKLDNYNVVNSILESVEREYSLHPEWGSTNVDAELAKYLSTPIEIKYHSEGKRIVGEKFVDSEEALRKEIERVKGLGSILIISDDVTKYSAIEGVEVRPSTNVNGGEFDYVFVDKKWMDHNSSKFDLMRDLYTVSQRSTQATIMIDYGITNALAILSKDSPESNAPYVMSDKERDAFKNWRRGSLNRISPTDNFEENTSYYRIKPVKITPPAPKPEVKGETPPPPPAPTLEAKTDPGEEIPPAATDPGLPSPSPTPPGVTEEVKGSEAKPIEPPIVPKDPAKSPTPSTGNFVPESTLSVGQEIEEQIKQKKAPMYLGDFYSTIYEGEGANPAFIQREESQPTSLYNFVNGRLTDNEYVQLISLISALIRRNEKLINSDGKINVKAFNKIQRRFKTSSIMFFNEFKKHIETYGCRLELRAISTTQSELYIVSGNDNHELRIYAGIVNSGKSGIYTGEFTQVRGPRYNKSNQTKRIRVSEIAGMYPGLHVGSQWGIITVKENDTIPEDMKGFLLGENNSGKTQILCTDDPLYTDAELGGLFRTTQKTMPDGTVVNWAYADDHTVTLAGVQRALKPSDVLKYVHAMHAKRSVTKENYRKAAAFISGHDVSTLSEEDINNIVEDYIAATTTSSRHIIAPLDNKLWAQYFTSLNHSQYHVLHDGGRFVAECLKTPEVREKILKNLTAIINQRGSVVKSRNGLAPDKVTVWYDTAMFMQVGESMYEVRSNGSNSYTIIAPDGSQYIVRGNTMMYPFETITDAVLQLANATMDDIVSVQFKDYDLRPGKDMKAYDWDQNELIYWMFYADGEAMSLADADRLLPQHFYAQGYADTVRYPNSFWSKHKSTQQDANDAESYTTTAVDWTYSMFVLDDSKIQTGSKQKQERQMFEKDKFDGMREEIDEIAKANDMYIPTFTYSPDESVDQEIESYIDAVNFYESLSAKSWIFKEIVRNGNSFTIKSNSDVKNWLLNLATVYSYPLMNGEVTIYDDFKENGTWKYMNFSVTLSGIEEHFIAKLENGIWKATPFNSGAEYNQLMQILKGETMGLISEEDQKVIKRYVLSIQTGNTTFELAENYINVMSSKTDEAYNTINAAIMNYLTKRLELHDC